MMYATRRDKRHLLLNFKLAPEVKVDPNRNKLLT